MKITCASINEALNIIANTEKSVMGETNMADQLELEVYDTLYRLAVDYTDAQRRCISIYGLNNVFSTPRVYKDNEISLDEIASELYTDSFMCVGPVLDYLISSFYSVQRITVTLKPDELESVKIDTSEKWCEEGMDSLCPGYVHPKVLITYQDEDDHEKKVQGIKRWMDQNKSHALELLET